MSFSDIRGVTASVKLSEKVGDKHPACTLTAIKVAQSIAKKLGVPLRLVTVFEPNDAPPWGNFPMPSGIASSNIDLHEALRLGREAALSAMRTEIMRLVDGMQDVKATGSVVEAFDAAQGVISDAISHSGNLIVVGTAKKSYDYSFQGFSTALSLVNASPVPVLVVPEECELSFESPAFKVLIADDLREGSERLLRSSIGLMSMLSPCQMNHVHILASSLWSMFSNVSEGDVRAECATEMKRRSKPFVEKLKPGSVYESDVRIGDVADTLLGLIRERRPDLVAFGRHVKLSLRPFMIGQMSANAMLGLRKPVLIVP